jgi:alkylation response protein AidB-like acyl-CoA dehydrogenase
MHDPTPDELVEAAEGLVPLINSLRDEIEETREMPTPLVNAMAEADFFRLYLPRSIGGLEVDPITAMRVVEATSKADGSVGWCSVIAIVGAFFAAWLEKDIAYSLFGNPPDVRLAGSFRPEGTARIVDGGYRVTGRWDLASGVNFSSHFVATCKVADGNGLRMTPSGTPETRIMLVPVASSTVEDTWKAVGMRGTGSHDIVVDDVFIPAEHAFSLSEPARQEGLLYHPRLLMIAAWSLNVGNALGIARGAMDSFISLATDRGSTSSATLLADRPMVQSMAAEAEAIISSARAYVIDSVNRAWKAFGEGKSDPACEIASARLAITYAINEAVRAVDILFRAAGTNAIYTKHPLERYFRDVHVAVQHGSGSPTQIESSGKALLGRNPPGPGW